MYLPDFGPFAPNSIDEAVALLGDYGEDAKILAGGQSLIPMMKLRIAAPRYLVDVNRIESLTGIRRLGDRLVCGALCRHAEMAESILVSTELPILTDAARLTADVQVRNRGTLGGSLAHADPGGDWPAVLMALDADVTIVGPSGSRTVPLETFLVDAYTTVMRPDEMLIEISVPFSQRPCGGAYAKFERRAGDFAVVSVGVQLELDERGHLRTVGISVGALGTIPVRVRQAEKALTGTAGSPGDLDRAAALLQEAADPFADTRGSVEYKRHLAGVLFRRAFTAARQRAQGMDVRTLHP